MQCNEAKNMSEYFPSIKKPTTTGPGIIRKVKKVCDIHGEYTCNVIGLLKPGTTLEQYQFVNVYESPCPKCDDERASQEARDAIEKSRWLGTYAKAGIPERFKEASLKQYITYDETQKQALSLVKEWLHGKFNNLIALGRGGTGKTYLMCAALRILAYYGKTVRYITEEEFCSEIKATYSDSNLTELSVMGKYLKYDYLVIDEIGRSVGTTKDLNLISTLLIKRYENAKPTALATNLTEIELSERFDEPVNRKINEDCKKFVSVWESYEAYCKKNK